MCRVEGVVPCAAALQSAIRVCHGDIRRTINALQLAVSSTRDVSVSE